MNIPWLDLGLVAILVAFAANGLRQGLVRQAASLMGLLLGLTLAIVLYIPLMHYWASTPESETTLGPLVFAAILLGIWGMFNLLGLIAWKRLHTKDNNWGDDIGGALLGLVAGALALAVCLAGFAGLDRALAQQVERSPLSLGLLNLTAAFFRSLPSIIRLPAWLH